jgi:hypothetical protein
MKIIGRTLAILAAALVIVGALLAFASSSYTTGLGSGMPDRPAVVQTSTTETATNGGAAAASATAGFHHAEASGASLFGIVEVLKNLIIVGVIITIVALGKRLLGRKRQPGQPARCQKISPTAEPSV